MEIKKLIYFLPGPILMLIGLIINIVSFSTAHWSKDQVSNAGLWKMCLGLSPRDSERQCFHYSSRSHLPLMTFVCSALSTVGLILLSISAAWSILSFFQNKKRSRLWTQKSGTLCLISVVFNLFALCIYAGSFESISYDMIPKWSGVYDMTLSWSFTVGCIGTCLSLIGSTISIYVALKFGTNVHISTNVSRVPPLHVHPPPSSRLSSPPRFGTPRVSSPLPFSTKAYSSNSKRNITPVNIS
ncbi:uncharacterized protein LOC133201825 [Saccostrea echinata]|uniref:uncharacterized protein LOC133201825 n=1 Tax=Saccostrea echinata TaxID=191078 RepID=UPI002A8157B6|nr:uncharacterized protein LOC133201825 [Saccostrea echinata]